MRQAIQFLTHVFFALLAILLPQFATTANACTCLAIPAPYQAFQQSGAVFAGRVVGSTDIPVETHQHRGKTYTIHERRYRVLVTEAFKGAQPGEVEVTSGRDSCSITFEVGESYLFYASYASPTVFSTYLCTRTGRLAEAVGEVHYLRAMLKGAPEPRVYGSVVRREVGLSKDGTILSTPLAGIKVVVEGGGRRFEAATDKDGLFSLSKVPDGKYRASAWLPDKYYGVQPVEFILGSQERPDHPSTQQGSSAYAEFVATWRNQIKGWVRDTEGNPVRHAKVSVLRAGSTPDSPPVESFNLRQYPYGSFHVPGLTPGKYLVSARVRMPPLTSKPLLVYYPSAASLSQAAEITVGETDEPEVDLKLPAGYVLGRVEGVVVHTDGSPVPGAWVFLADAENSEDDDKKYDWMSVDKQGRFSLEGFVGSEYWVHATFHREELKATPIKVQVKKASEPLKIVIPLPKQ